VVLLPDDCVNVDLAEESAKRFLTNAMLWLGQTTDRSLIVNFTGTPVVQPNISIYDFYLHGYSTDVTFLNNAYDRVRNGGGLLICRNSWEVDNHLLTPYDYPANK
jgi:hypothetical protein